VRLIAFHSNLCVHAAAALLLLLLNVHVVCLSLFLSLLRVTAFVAGHTGVNSTATLSVFAKPSELFASVAGGSARLQSRLKAVELDGGGSRDPDLPHSTGHLAFRWDCYDYARKDACAHAGNNTLVVLPEAAVAEVKARWLRAGLYRITLVVSCPADGRNASTSVELELAPTEVRVCVQWLTCWPPFPFSIGHGAAPR